MSILLGLSSGLCWGTADFFGGLLARRLPALAVAVWSQLAGGLALGLVLAASGAAPTGGALAWGILAGLFGGTGLLLFYRALAAGVMSIVAPISACGAVVPILVAAASGEAPGALALAGIGFALLGVALVSLPAPGGATSHPSGRPGLVLALALGAALSFGGFFVGLDRGAAAAGAAGPATLWVIGGARIGSLLTLLSLALLGRQPVPLPRQHGARVALIGVADTLANVLFTYATLGGNLGVVSVLGSLYPVATVLLARAILAERLARPQAAGVLLALAGVILMASS